MSYSLYYIFISGYGFESLYRYAGLYGRTQGTNWNQRFSIIYMNWMFNLKVIIISNIIKLKSASYEFYRMIIRR